MSLYPSLEDMKADQMLNAQHQLSQPLYPSNVVPPQYPSAAPSVPVASGNELLYPNLNDYMGLSLSSDELALVLRPTFEVAQPQQLEQKSQVMIAPLTGNSVGLHRANVTHGIRQVVLCKDKDGKVGMRVQAINNGVFVVFVQADSPAKLVGLRFGDQILQINDENVAGFTVDKVHSIIKKMPVNGIRLAIRDRPFERTVTLVKDSVGHVGFAFKNRKITSIVKDSAAARNGLLTEHHILEVDGQNVVGMEDKQVRKIMESAEGVITITIMPSYIFDHMMKCMATSLVKKLMDHSIPDL